MGLGASRLSTAFYAGSWPTLLLKVTATRTSTMPSIMSTLWQRVTPDRLMPTITTAAEPSCSCTGHAGQWGDIHNGQKAVI